MKKLNRLIAFFLCATLIIQLFGCRTKRNSTNDTASVNGATVFHALKNQVAFDSELQETENAEDLFVGLPEGSDVTLLTGPDTHSDQLGMIQVQYESDLDAAEQSVNNYLQNMYDSVYAEDPGEAEKFENVAIWKNEVYIIFCITINYTSATQIINNTVNGSLPPNQPGSTTESDLIAAFSGTWELTGHPTVQDLLAEAEFYDATSLNFSFSSGSVTLTYGDESYTTQSFEIAKINGYSCLLLQLYGEDLGFVLINPDMLGYIYCGEQYGEKPTGPSLHIQGQDYSGDFFPMSNIFMRKGSGTTKIPEYVNFSEWDTEFDRNDVFLFYYPTSNILQVFGSSSYDPIYCEGMFYLYSSGSLEYMECISLPWADGLPADSIYTDHNFVITDNM